MQKRFFQRAVPLLCYPSALGRRSVVSFIAASSESLGAVDSYVFLAPVICPLLHRQPMSLASERALLSCLKPPVSRQVFFLVLESSRSSDMLERQRKIWYSSSQSKLWEMDLLEKGIEELDSLKNWIDKQQGPEVQQAVSTASQQPGLSDCDKAEAKLRDMGAFMHNDSNMVERDPQLAGKLNFSGFMSPFFSGVKSLIYEKPSEGIPLYSFSVDRQGMGIPPAASDSPLQMNSLVSVDLPCLGLTHLISPLIRLVQFQHQSFFQVHLASAMDLNSSIEWYMNQMENETA